MTKIDPKKLLKLFNSNEIYNFYGVPDSLLKNFVSIIKDKHNFICANEGLAVSMAIGDYLASKKLNIVYMQNSGLGNAINPLISLADKKVYSIPLFLVIGWRGHDEKSDEPQHNSKGKITKKILNLLNIKYQVLEKENDMSKIEKLIKFSIQKKRVVALVVKPNTFIKSNLNFYKNKYVLKRYEVIKSLLHIAPKNSRFISSTGFNSRELYQARLDINHRKGKDFYLVGGMGHTLSLSLGYLNRLKTNNLFCIDGDGSLIMHLGSLHMMHSLNLNKIKYILFNNLCHESVGSQKTNSDKIDFKKLSEIFGFKKFFKIKNNKDVNTVLRKFVEEKKSCFLLANVKNESLQNLLRPKNLIKIKNFFCK